MAGCAGGGASSPVPLDPLKVEQLSVELHKCVRKDHLVKAKFLLKGLRKDEKRQIVSRMQDGNTPLFTAAQQGQVHFVNYLVEECNADIEQRGVYEVHEDRSKHQVTPLWCAAVANKLEVVKTLVKHGAQVNATSDTQSTPVRSACFMSNIEVVKYLVENGADIHKPNVNGGTCLINSVQSVDLCKFLIEKGADPNAQDNSGNLAMHYAIREGRLETVKLLIKSGSDPYRRNDFGDDAFHTASLRGYQEILEYLVYKIKPAVKRQVEAYELMGTNFVDEKHDIHKALQVWRSAMELRCRDGSGVPPKQHRPPNPAYQGMLEADNMEKLREISDNPDAIYMQSLLIRERILGTDHKDTIFGLMYRGAVYADMHYYQRCVDLWKYAFQLRHQRKEPLNHECLFTLQALCKLFWEISEENQAGFTKEQVQYADVREVLDMASQEVRAAGTVIHVRPVSSNQQEEFHMLLLLLLHLIHLLIKVDKNEAQTLHTKQAIHQIIRTNPRGADGKTLLHLAVDNKSSSVSEEFYSRLPDVLLMEGLIECGAFVNCRDEDGNTPLHSFAHAAATRFVQSEQIEEQQLTELQNVLDCLILKGAHVDARNEKGEFAGDLVSSCRDLKLSVMDHLTLKCLASRCIRDHKISYLGEVPASLIPFINLH